LRHYSPTGSPLRVEGDLRHSLHHVHAFAADVEASIRFYEGVFGGEVVFDGTVADFGFWRYDMVPAPDGILIELFEVTADGVPPALRGYFGTTIG
jgi:catechol 2,3-dioxygenase-like lactoylglutathione lyase family enzyme